MYVLYVVITLKSYALLQTHTTGVSFDKWNLLETSVSNTIVAILNCTYLYNQSKTVQFIHTYLIKQVIRQSLCGFFNL